MSDKREYDVATPAGEASSDRERRRTLLTSIVDGGFAALDFEFRSKSLTLIDEARAFHYSDAHQRGDAGRCVGCLLIDALKAASRSDHDNPIWIRGYLQGGREADEKRAAIERERVDDRFLVRRDDALRLAREWREKDGAAVGDLARLDCADELEALVATWRAPAASGDDSRGKTYTLAEAREVIADEERRKANAGLRASFEAAKQQLDREHAEELANLSDDELASEIARRKDGVR